MTEKFKPGIPDETEFASDNIVTGKKNGKEAISPLTDEQKKQILSIVSSEYRYKSSILSSLLEYISDNNLPADLYEDPEIFQAIKKAIIKGFDGDVNLPTFLDLTKKIKCFDKLYSDAETKEIVEKHLVHYYTGDESEDIKKYNNPDEMKKINDVLNSNEELVERILVKIIEENFKNRAVESLHVLSKKIGYSVEKTTGIIKNYISNSSFSKEFLRTIKRYVESLKSDNKIELADFKESLMGSASKLLSSRLKVNRLEYDSHFSSYCDPKSISYLFDNLSQLANFDIGQEDMSEVIENYIEKQGIEGIITFLDEIPDTALQLLEDKYSLASFKKEMNLPLINIYNPHTYRKYLEAKKKGPEAINILIEELSKYDKANKSEELNYKISQTMIERGISPYTYRKEILDKNEGKEKLRNLNQVRLFLGQAFEKLFGDKDIDFIKGIEKYTKPKDAIKILDIGAGEGVALMEIKKLIEKDGFKVEATALEVDNFHFKNLGYLQKYGEIDKAINALAEEFKNDENYDFIMDVYAAISYCDVSLRMNLISKFANMLNDKGIMVVAFDFQSFESDQIASECPHVIQRQIISPIENRYIGDVEKQSEYIKKILSDQGFKVEVNIRDIGLRVRGGRGYHVALFIQKS